MRNCISFGLIVLASLVANSTLAAEEKEEKKKREELKEKLKRIERELGTDEVEEARGKKSIAAIVKVLMSADQMTVYRIDPSTRLKKAADPEAKPKNDAKYFHEYEILAESKVEKAEKRKEIVTFLGKEMHWSEWLRAKCFIPRHGVSVKSGMENWEFVICFQCAQMHVYRDGESLSTITLVDIHDKNTIRELVPEKDEKKAEAKDEKKDRKP
ncbi:MAG: hypothetical protein KF873_14190 [Gemmataceae bacterium]|nr:hypothetical protein [Gemmataceae bacterium]